ncbi:homoserine O-acetyltransferase/O-succinyltransferase family protein [Tepidibacter formicigenes]|jgi:homoserine O-succinyltransferase|uniref:Homoserine O-succinyltransferase n=1 Tax=Tepidibacter formicigenes DSM 15518 TaxID=1123349 RepID=A0A1M6N9I0_9FIRM|nr:homoserine O-succinyltransferase [Tepidibacter formicigenes DSM 15518]
MTLIKEKVIENIKDLEIISESSETGIYIVQSKDLKNIFITGHSEYDLNITLILYITSTHSNLSFSNWIKILNIL